MPPAHNKTYNKTNVWPAKRSTCTSTQLRQGFSFIPLLNTGWRLEKVHAIRLIRLWGCSGWSEFAGCTNLIIGCALAHMYIKMKLTWLCWQLAKKEHYCYPFYYCNSVINIIVFLFIIVTVLSWKFMSYFCCPAPHPTHTHKKKKTKEKRLWVTSLEVPCWGALQHMFSWRKILCGYPLLSGPVNNIFLVQYLWKTN